MIEQAKEDLRILSGTLTLRRLRESGKILVVTYEGRTRLEIVTLDLRANPTSRSP